MIVSTGVSKLGRMDLIFIDAGVNINRAYYREVLLTQKLLSVMRENCDEFLICQQGDALVHQSPSERETAAFISSDL